MARKRDDAAMSVAMPSEEQVAGYLRLHPDFLARNPDLVSVLAPPSRWSEGDGVIDMQMFMIERLRDEIERIKGTAEHIILTSRSNMSTQSRTHRAVVALLGAETLAALVAVVGDDLPDLLDVDVATLCFEPSGRALPELEVPGIRRLPAGMVERELGGLDRECALTEEVPGDPILFGNGSGLVVSSAVVRVVPGGVCPEGLLALGSRHGRTFHSGQGTDLLIFLARVVESCVRRFIVV